MFLQKLKPLHLNVQMKLGKLLSKNWLLIRKNKACNEMTTQNTSRVIDSILEFTKGCAIWCHLRKTKLNNYQLEKNINYSTTL